MKDDTQFYKPPEWGYHSATQMHWPSNTVKRSMRSLKRLEDIYSEIIEELHFFEVIHLFVRDLQTRNRVMNKLSLKAIDLDRIVIHQKPVNDIWARDCGPCFAKNRRGEKTILNWNDNASGQNYESWKDDNSISSYVANLLNIESIETGMVLESGSMYGNGEGLILTTETVLMNKNQNTNLTKDEIEQTLKKYLGTEQVIWLRSGISADGKNGHNQYVPRWLNSDTILTAVTDYPKHPDFEILQENLERLKILNSKLKAPLKIETINLPSVRSEKYEDYLPASYTGFYIANGAVLVPQFKIESDKTALKLFKKYFPGRTIIPIESTVLANEHGSIHGIINPWY